MVLLQHFLVIAMSLFWTHPICPCLVVDSSLWKFVKSLFLAWDIEVCSCLRFWHFCPIFWSSPCHLFVHTSYAHFLVPFLWSHAALWAARLIILPSGSKFSFIYHFIISNERRSSIINVYFLVKITKLRHNKRTIYM